MRQPKRSDDKYCTYTWTGTRVFHREKFISDLQDYIDLLYERIEALSMLYVSQQRQLLIAFLEMNNWFSLEDRKNAEGVVDCYLKAINCG